MKMTFTAVAASLAFAATTAAAPQAQGTRTANTRLQNVNADAVFRTWDTNNDQQVTKQEFMSGLRDQRWFQRFDTGNNGRISKAEFKAHLKSMNVYRNADLNHDGSVDQLEVNRVLGTERAGQWNTEQPASITEDELYDRLYASWSKGPSAGITQQEILAGAFQRADRDNNGIISRTEFARDIALARGDAPATPGMQSRSRENARDNSQAMSEPSSRTAYGADQAVGTSGRAATATVEDIVDNPNQYIGQTVTVSGNVGDVFGSRVFNIEERGMIDVDDELIVVAPKNAAMVTEDANVQVRGEMRRVTTHDLEAEYGASYWTDWGIDQNFFQARESHPVLFAQTLDIRH